MDLLAASDPVWTTVAAELQRSVAGAMARLLGVVDPAGAQNVLKMNVEDCKANPTLCGNVKPDDKVDTTALFDNSFAQKANGK